MVDAVGRIFTTIFYIVGLRACGAHGVFSTPYEPLLAHNPLGQQCCTHTLRITRVGAAQWPGSRLVVGKGYVKGTAAFRAIAACIAAFCGCR